MGMKLTGIICCNEQVFGEAKLTGPENMVGYGKEFCRLFGWHIGCIPLTADRQQQWMNTSCVNGMDFFHSRNFIGYGGTCNLVN